MARVNVEQKALSDPRFSILGSHLMPLNKASQETIETAYGLFQMIRVWNYCMERGLLAVYRRDLDALHGGLSDAMIDAELGELVRGSDPPLVRIKGGEGLLDWLTKKRQWGKLNGAKGAAHGIKGGRPRKNSETPRRVIEKRVEGFRENPPPSPSPSPSLKEKSGAIPTLEQVTEYCRERKNAVDPQRFVDFYASKGWMVGKNRMKDWRAAVRTWEKNENEKPKVTAVKKCEPYALPFAAPTEADRAALKAALQGVVKPVGEL